MVRLISRQRGGLSALKLTKLFGINDFPAAKDSGKVVIITIYCYLIIIITLLAIIRRSDYSRQVPRKRVPGKSFQVKDKTSRTLKSLLCIFVVFTSRK